MYKLFSTFSKIIFCTGLSFNAFSCGWFMPDESLRFSLFNAELFQDKAHRPLYYNMNLNGYTAEMLSKDEKLLAEEWKKELKLKSSVDEIRSYFFGGLSLQQLNVHPFRKEIKQNKDLQKFLGFAKVCEYNISYLDPWSDQDFFDRQDMLPRLIAEGERLIREEKSQFWKKKYAFQLLRLTFYNNEAAKFHHYYKTWFGAGKEKSTMGWWATHYYSDWIAEKATDLKADWWEKNYSSFPAALKNKSGIDQVEAKAYANYLHAMVFRNSSNKAYISKHLYSSRHFNKQLRFARNNEEIANLYVLRHLNNHLIDLKSIDSIVKYDPGHPQLKLILTRELNKYEELEGEKNYFVYTHGFRYFYTGYDGEYKDERRKYPELNAFKKQVESLVVWKKSNKDQYHLFMTHLNILLQNMKEAKESLVKVTSSSKDLVFQKHVYATCILASDKDVESEQVQNEMAENLFFLLNHREGIFESDRVMFSLCSYLSKVFEGRKIHHFAGVFSYYAKTKFTIDGTVYSPFDYFDEKTEIKSVEKLISIFGDKKKNKLEEFIFLPFQNDYDFRTLLSRLYLRTGQTHKASEVIQKIPDSYWSFEFGTSEVLQSDPFTLVIVPRPNDERLLDNDNDKQLERMEGLSKFNRKQIMKALDSLENSVKQENTQDLLKLGNAWYNFSANGKNWQVISYFNAFDRGPHLKRLINICQDRSLGYYRKLLQTRISPETKAHACYMIALIAAEREDIKSYRKASKEYEQLKNTAFYKGMNCSYTKSGKF